MAQASSGRVANSVRVSTKAPKGSRSFRLSQGRTAAAAGGGEGGNEDMVAPPIEFSGDYRRSRRGAPCDGSARKGNGTLPVPSRPPPRRGLSGKLPARSSVMSVADYRKELPCERSRNWPWP